MKSTNVEYQLNDCNAKWIHHTFALKPALITGPHFLHSSSKSLILSISELSWVTELSNNNVRNNTCKSFNLTWPRDIQHIQTMLQSVQMWTFKHLIQVYFALSSSTYTILHVNEVKNRTQVNMKEIWGAKCLAELVPVRRTVHKCTNTQITHCLFDILAKSW